MFELQPVTLADATVTHLILTTDVLHHSLSPPPPHTPMSPPYYYKQSKLLYPSSFSRSLLSSLMQHFHWDMVHPMDSKAATQSTCSQYKEFWCPYLRLSKPVGPRPSLSLPWYFSQITFPDGPLPHFSVQSSSFNFISAPQSLLTRIIHPLHTLLPLLLDHISDTILTIVPISLHVESLAYDLLNLLFSDSFFSTCTHYVPLQSDLLIPLGPACSSLSADELWSLQLFSSLICTYYLDHLSLIYPNFLTFPNN